MKPKTLLYSALVGNILLNPNIASDASLNINEDLGNIYASTEELAYSPSRNPFFYVPKQQPNYDSLRTTIQNSESKKSQLEKISTTPSRLELNLTDDLTLLTTLVYEEGRECSKPEKTAIAHTVYNRLRSGRYGKDLIHIALAEKQYSCFNSYNPRKGKEIVITKKNQREWNEAFEVARGVLSGIYSDPTRGATHYFNPRGVITTPSWVNELKRVKIPGVKTEHLFYRDN